MHVPIALLIVMALLAAPTAARLAMSLDRTMDGMGLRLLGLRETYHDDGTRVERWCLLYVPVLTRRGWHSTLWLD